MEAGLFVVSNSTLIQGSLKQGPSHTFQINTAEETPLGPFGGGE